MVEFISNCMTIRIEFQPSNNDYDTVHYHEVTKDDHFSLCPDSSSDEAKRHSSSSVIGLFDCKPTLYLIPHYLLLISLSSNLIFQQPRLTAHPEI